LLPNRLLRSRLAYKRATSLLPTDMLGMGGAGGGAGPWARSSQLQRV
jgi:hypothetical protein